MLIWEPSPSYSDRKQTLSLTSGHSLKHGHNGIQHPYAKAPWRKGTLGHPPGRSHVSQEYATCTLREPTSLRRLLGQHRDSIMECHVYYATSPGISGRMLFVDPAACDPNRVAIERIGIGIEMFWVQTAGCPALSTGGHQVIKGGKEERLD